MNKIKYFLMALLAVLTFAACETEDENKEPQWSDYFSMKVTNCERVGSKLKVDFTLKNISGKDVQGVGLNGGSVWDMCQDDKGEKYYSEVSVSGENWITCPEFDMAKGETISGSFLIKSYDTTNSSKKFHLIFNGRCQSVGFDGTADIGTFKVVDNRVLHDGFDTNDQILVYNVVDCVLKRVNGEDNVYLTYQVTNKSDINLPQFQQNMGRVKDNISEEYNSEISLNGGSYNQSIITSLAAGATKTFTIKVKRVRSNATSLSGNVFVQGSSYPWTDNEARFYDVTIHRDN